PGTGAAGGAGFGLVALLGARIEPGAPLVIEAAGLDQALEGAAAVFTGEGRVDRQTAFGKGPMEVARRGRAAGAEVVILAGSLGEGWRRAIADGISVVPIAAGPATLEEMERDAEGLIEGAAERACRLMAPGLGREARS
ncbi:MAG: glycerate kinase, partial [Candidatus Dormibacteraceae bacterium]